MTETPTKLGALNLRILAISNILIALLGLVTTIAVISDVSETFASSAEDGMFKSAGAIVAAVLMLVPQIAMVIAGIGYLLRKRWSRTLGFVLSVIMTLGGMFMLFLAGAEWMDPPTSASKRSAITSLLMAAFIFAYCLWTWLSLRSNAAKSHFRLPKCPGTTASGD